MKIEKSVMCMHFSEIYKSAFWPHRTHETRPIAIDDPGICQSVCHVGSFGIDVQKPAERIDTQFGVMTHASSRI